MNRLLPAACAALVFSSAACASQNMAANPCGAEIDKINSALARTTMTPEAAREIDALVKKGDALCKQGKTEEGIAVLKEAQKMLGV